MQQLSGVVREGIQLFWFSGLSVNLLHPARDLLTTLPRLMTALLQASTPALGCGSGLLPQPPILPFAQIVFHKTFGSLFRPATTQTGSFNASRKKKNASKTSYHGSSPFDFPGLQASSSKIRRSQEALKGTCREVLMH